MAWNPLNALLGLFSRDIGIDLGTANTLVLVRGKGVVINEPSVVAMNPKTKRVLAVGAEAKEMVGRTPANIVAVRPLKDGVISDFDVTEQMLRYFIEKVHEQYAIIPRPRVVIGISSGVTEVERRAEEVKIAIGGGEPVGVRGRDLKSGLPAEIQISPDEVKSAIAGSVNTVLDAVTDTIEETPPELVADLMVRGITLAGGGALVPGIVEQLTERTRMRIVVADDPLGCVVRGTGKVLG